MIPITARIAFKVPLSVKKEYTQTALTTSGITQAARNTGPVIFLKREFFFCIRYAIVKPSMFCPITEDTVKISVLTSAPFTAVSLKSRT